MASIREIDSETGLRADLAKRLKALETKADVIVIDDAGRIAAGSRKKALERVVATEFIMSEMSAGDVQNCDEKKLDVALPEAKCYERNGRTFVGFSDGDLPKIVKVDDGYSLIALIALLVYKVNKLEKSVSELSKNSH
ncbi:MAG: hypothetical protein NZ988_06070 [Thaumarchaeota archaeon]|nr:hypothetical protein [Candidatus Calditenuaceae archaeon]MDW8187590.1 hypothetical protein [Nitrososphaerota archaeon]